MARISLVFHHGDHGRFGFDGTLNREQLLKLRETVPQSVSDPADKAKQLINKLLHDGIAGFDRVSETGRMGLAQLIMWWVVWETSNPDLQEVAGVEDITTEFSLKDGHITVETSPGATAVNFLSTLAPSATKIHDYASEIVGSLPGGRIFLNTVRGILHNRGDYRILVMRLDDNDASGEMTGLVLQTLQPVADLTDIAKLGGILEISVDHIEEEPRDDLDYREVHGTVRMLAPAIYAGGPIKDKLPKEVKYHPGLGALICPTFDAKGEVNCVHVLCLAKDGRSKVSAAEKRRRVRRSENKVSLWEKSAKTLTEFWDHFAEQAFAGVTALFRQSQATKGRAIMADMLRLPFIAGVHAVHHVHTIEDHPIALDALAREYRDNIRMNHWCETHRNAAYTGQSNIGLRQTELWTQIHTKPWDTMHDEAFWAGAEAALKLSLEHGFALDEIEREAQGWRAKTRTAHISPDDDLIELAQQLLNGNPLTKVAAEVLDNTVGRGNWRFDPKQQVWILRTITDGKVRFAAVRRVNDTYRDAAVDLPQSALAAWWQRLGAAGGSQSVMPLFATTVKLLNDDQSLRHIVEGSFEESYIKQLAANAKLISRHLHGAHKFKWDKSFSQMVYDAADSRPQTLLNDLLVTARLPYETGNVWFEWERQFDDTLGVWGALVMPYGNGISQALVMTPDNGIEPGVLLFDFRNPIPFASFGYHYDPTTPQNWAVLGRPYITRWHKGNHAVLDQLSRHAAVKLGGPLYGDDHPEIWEDQSRFGRVATRIGGVFRELLSGWALAVTHIDDEPLVAATTIRTKPFYGGHHKFHPSYEYKHIVWRRPQELPKLLRRIRRIVRSGVMRYTDVSGHWVHRRAATKDCSIHPRACIRAQWRSTKRPEGLWGHDDPPVAEHDYQKCIHCTRPRWWCKDHGRGDPQHGIIEKSYEITASTGRKRRPPPLPAPLDPPPDPSLVTAEPVDD